VATLLYLLLVVGGDRHNHGHWGSRYHLLIIERKRRGCSVYMCYCDGDDHEISMVLLIEDMEFLM
jgi:hypothetical protein